MSVLIDIVYASLLNAFLSFGLFLALKYARTFLMSYGEFVVLGGYISSYQSAGAPGWAAALALSAAAGAAGGAGTYALLRPMFLRGRTMDGLLVTWGSALVMMNLYRLCFGADGRFAPTFFDGIRLIGATPFPLMRAVNLVTIGLVACILAGVLTVLNRRRRMTTMAFGHRIAAEYGVPVPGLLLAILALAGAAGCVSGVLVAQEAAITPYGGVQYTILAALAALVAGPRLWSGVLVAAILAGVRTGLGFFVGLTPAWLIVLLLVVIGASLQRNPVTAHETA